MTKKMKLSDGIVYDEKIPDISLPAETCISYHGMHLFALTYARTQATVLIYISGTNSMYIRLKKQWFGT